MTKLDIEQGEVRIYPIAPHGDVWDLSIHHADSQDEAHGQLLGPCSAPPDLAAADDLLVDLDAVPGYGAWYRTAPWVVDGDHYSAPIQRRPEINALLGTLASGLAWWRPAMDGHLLVLAPTGGGKTSTLTLIAAQLGVLGPSPLVLSLALDQAYAAIDAAAPGGVAVLDEVEGTPDQIADLLTYADQHHVTVAMSFHTSTQVAGVQRFGSRLSLGQLTPAASRLLWGSTIGTGRRDLGHGLYASPGVPQPTPIVIFQP